MVQKTDNWDNLLVELERYGELFDGHRREVCAGVRQLPPPTRGELQAILSAVEDYFAGLGDAEERDVHAAGQLVTAITPHLLRTKELFVTDQQQQELEPVLNELRNVYRGLGQGNLVRHQILRAFATLGIRPAMERFTECIIEDPPTRSRSADLAFVPLWRQDSLPVDALFPDLFKALTHPSVAALVLDLANFVTRKKMVDEHPAHDRSMQLAELFAHLAESMKQLEERPTDFASSADELSEIISRSVSLGAALADALGLIGDKQHIGDLRKALAIGHRRIRAEAAAALAQLGEEEGIEVLVELARDPGARLRALAYLEEFDALDRVDEEFRSPEARAEAELASFLSHPSQFGLPPSRLELLDGRDLKWPGYSEPVTCFLFRYTYQFPSTTLERIGLVGPITYSQSADMNDLSLAELYSLYCGWHVDHAEIIETLPDDMSDADWNAFAWPQRQLQTVGYENVALRIQGTFFGHRFYVLEAEQQGQPGILIFDHGDVTWRPRAGSWQSLGPREAYFVHIGRKILREFNPQDELF